jgi:DNA-binding NarL/FixJ family response regulator
VSTLTEREREVVTLIRAGFTRRHIARVLEIPEDGFEGERETVRGVVNDLCARFDCRMDKLPQAVARAQAQEKTG